MAKEEKSKAIVLQDRIGGLTSEIEKVLPRGIPSEKFIRIAQAAVVMNPAIVTASVQSIMTVCMKAAADGLILDGREAAIVVYRTKKGPMAQYMPMIAGITKKVLQSDQISTFSSQVVYENDEFDMELGTKPSIYHKPTVRGEPGDALGVYSVATFSDGTQDLEWMTVAQVQQIRNRFSKAKGDGPWVTDYTEMARKTVARRLAKRLPQNTDIMKVFESFDEGFDIGGNNDEPSIETPRKKRGGAAAALGDIEVTDVNPDTGEVVESEDPAPKEEKPKPKPKPKPKAKVEEKPKETAKQKKVRETKEALEAAMRAAEAAAKEADDTEGEETEDVDPSEGDEGDIQATDPDEEEIV